MLKIKATPGPWTTDDGYIFARDGYTIASVEDIKGLSRKYLINKFLSEGCTHWAQDSTASRLISEEEAAANATLIAAAPDLVDALIAIRSFICTQLYIDRLAVAYPGKLIDKINAALEKAGIEEEEK